MASEAEVVSQVAETMVPAGAATVPLEGEQLKMAIMRQFEFYFSPENTATDAYLVSKMDDDKYVDLSIVAGFGKVKALTDDLDLIVASLQQSQLVELDSTKSKVRAVAVKPARTTLALRQVDPSATTEALTALFEAGGFKPTSMRSDIGNFWFADFSSEEETTNALEYIRTQKFADKPIRARIKTSTVLSTSSYYYPVEPVQPYYAGFVPMAGGWVPAAGAYAFPQGFEGQDGAMYMPGYAGKQGGDPGRGRGANRGKGGPRKDGTRKGQGGLREEDGKRKATRKGRNGAVKEAGAGAVQAGKNTDQKPPQLTPAHFPPLPGAQKGAKPGYKGAFKKYSAEELVERMKGLTAETPAELPDCAAVQSEPSAELESTKEAPPHFESIQHSGVTLSEVVKQSSKKEPTAAAPSSSAPVASQATDEASPKEEEKAAEPKPSEPAKPTWSQMVRKSGVEDTGSAASTA